MVTRKRVEAVANGKHDYWGWHDLTLSTGETIRVREVPPYLSDAAMAHLPLPKPPIVTIKSQMPGGGSETRPNPDDPVYQQTYAETLDARQQALDLFHLAWAVDYEPPEDNSWREDIASYLPNIKWAEGPHRNKIDYLRYIVIRHIDDFIAFKRIANGVKPITAEEVEAVTDSFRN